DDSLLNRGSAEMSGALNVAANIVSSPLTSLLDNLNSRDPQGRAEGALAVMREHAAGKVLSMLSLRMRKSKEPYQRRQVALSA
ncbi:MAG TPA: hypothetical protein VLF93_03150, partial [Candidatus Saccharimonadales bacterium]|nr:hypothetical protein [Candidatus Saccharimonadales bacterium]